MANTIAVLHPQDPSTLPADVKQYYRNYKVIPSFLTSTVLTEYHQEVIYKRALYQYAIQTDVFAVRLQKVYWQPKVGHILMALTYHGTPERRRLLLILKQIVDNLLLIDLLELDYEGDLSQLLEPPKFT
jgi:hypothetical protein